MAEKVRHEVLGIIRDPHYGCRDVDVPVLWFTAEMATGDCLQILGQPQADELIKAAQVYDVSRLAGCGIIVSYEGDSPWGATIRYERLR